MIETTLAQAVLILLFAVALRLLPASNPSTDNWGVLTKIANQRSGRWLSYRLPDALLPGIHPYPILVHYLISRLPRRWWFLAAVSITFAADVLVALALYGVVRFWLGPRHAMPETQAAWLGFWSAATFVSTPILLPVTARIRAANARAPSLPLVLGYLAAVGAAVFQHPAWVAPGVAFGLLCILASSFATQVVIAFSLVIAVVLGSWTPVLAMALTLAVAWSVPALGARDVLLFKLNHSLWYLRNRHKVPAVANRSLVRNAFRTSIELFRNPRTGRRLLFRESPVWIAAYSLPVLWYVLLALANADVGFRTGSDAMLEFAWACVLASAICFLLTASGPLAVFGQAERYFEYSSPLLVLLAAMLAAEDAGSASNAFATITLVNVAVVLSVFVLSQEANVRKLVRGIDSERCERELAAFLDTLGGEIRVATVPIKLSMLLSQYTRKLENSRVRYYYRGQIQGSRIDGLEYFGRDTEELDLFAGRPSDLVERYGIGWVVAERDFITKRREASAFARALLESPPAYQNERYRAFRL